MRTSYASKLTRARWWRRFVSWAATLSPATAGLPDSAASTAAEPLSADAAESLRRGTVRRVSTDAAGLYSSASLDPATGHDRPVLEQPAAKKPDHPPVSSSDAPHRRIRELEFCRQILSALIRYPEPKACARVLKLLLEAISARWGCLGRFTSDGALLCTVLGLPAQGLEPSGPRCVRLAPEAWPSLWRRCLETSQTLWEAPSAISVPGVSPSLRQAAVFPVRDGAETVGLLCLANLEGSSTRQHSGLIAAVLEPLGAAFRAWRERERGEEKQREIHKAWKLTQFAVDHSPGMVLTVDPRGRIIYVNKTACRTLGYEPEELVSRDIRDLFEGDAAESWDEWWEELKKRSSLRLEVWFRTSAGSLVPFDVLAGYLEFDGREFVPLICRDVSEDVAAKEELLRALEKEREAARLKSEFLANVNHELRTPLNGIIGMTELLSESPLSGEQRLYVETIYRASHDLLKMIEDILDLEKIEAGKLELCQGVFDPSKLLENVAGLFVKEAREKGIELQVERSPAPPSLLVGDAARIRQVLLNLVGNAVKFTPSGRIVLRADCLDIHGSRRRIRFSVEDSGIGIPEDKQTLIFERFSQIDGSPSRRHEGVGLGLAIVKDLVELMGGELGMESQVGRGSTFWFTLSLPVAERCSPVQEDHETGRGAPRLAPRWRRTPRVLVVEDNSINRMTAVRLLERLGCDVETACHGAEAVELVRGREYNLVLMDCEMPVMDGCEATRRIREVFGEALHIPVVAMTARVMKSDVQKCLDAGMDDHVSKPLRLADLELVLKNWIGCDLRSAPEPWNEMESHSRCRPAGPGGAS